jgi:hypothetical protein
LKSIEDIKAKEKTKEIKLKSSIQLILTFFSQLSNVVTVNDNLDQNQKDKGKNILKSNCHFQRRSKWGKYQKLISISKK